MGYPMTWSRVLIRNTLAGNYTTARGYAPNGWYDGEKFYSAEDGGPPWVPNNPDLNSALKMISGDLRRLERDAIDPGYWRQELAKRAGVDEETVVKVLMAFWDGDLPPPYPHDDQKGWTSFEGKFIEGPK